MNAITNLMMTVALLWALAAAGETTKGQANVSSSSATSGASSRLLSDEGCPDWGCGSNHNETLVRDEEPMK